MVFTMAVKVTGLVDRIPGAIRHFCTGPTDGIPRIQLERGGLQVAEVGNSASSVRQFAGAVTDRTSEPFTVHMLAMLT